MRLLLFVLILCFPGVALANARLVEVSCSAALFKMAGMSLDQKALVLTAGHCSNLGTVSEPGFHGLTFLGPEEVVIDERHSGHVDIRGLGGKFHRYPYSRVILATLTGMDVEVLELDATYRAILARQADAEIYELSPIATWPGASMTAVSANKNDQFSCEVEKLVPTVKEGLWTWTNLVRFRLTADCTFYPGVSGSPILDRHHRIVGVASTVSYPGTPCDINAPCEISDDAAPRVAPTDQSYAIATNRLYDCYSASRRAFDFTLPTCTLAPTASSPGTLAGPAKAADRQRS